ncbi:hypothetical protein evm_015148 [Chilo suppressalis]|nr:hypothetical protein evm_015148 [Chilo suppressalis]
MVAVNGVPLRVVQDYVYLGQTLRLGRNNFEREVNRRIQLGWAAFRKLRQVFSSPIPQCLKSKVLDHLKGTCGVMSVVDKSGEAEFVRNQYYGLEWQQGACEDWEAQAQAQGRDAGEKVGCGVLVTDADLYCRLLLQRAGCYHYYFVYDTPESSIGPQGSGWFQVAPTLRVGRDERIPLDGVTSLTVLAKCLGPLPRWESALRPAREAGYNLVHLTPVQVKLIKSLEKDTVNKVQF